MTKRNEIKQIIREEILLLESKSSLIKMFKQLAQYPIKKLKTILKTGWKEFKSTIRDARGEPEALKLINKKFKTNYKNLDAIDKLVFIKEESEQLTEDFQHYVLSLKDTVYTSSLVMGMLEIWLQLSKLLDGNTPNYKRLAFFGTLWLILASSKYYGEWKSWKKTQTNK